MIPAQAERIQSLRTFFALSLPASLVINLNHIHTNNTKRSTIIANRRYWFTNWIYQVIRSDCDSTCVGQVKIISLFPSVAGKVKVIACTDDDRRENKNAGIIYFIIQIK